jgi:hypothetical protein
MGFVSQHTKQSYLSSFHPISFVLFRTDVYNSSTVVVCTLTTRNHIQLNMQDRLPQLVQINQYQAHKIIFLMIISNELVGVDISLNYSSCFGYNAMGFYTSTVTQDHDNTDVYFWNYDSLSHTCTSIWRFFYLGKILLHGSTS